MQQRLAGALLAALMVLGCSQEPVAPATDELVLAEQAQAVAQEVAAATGTTAGGWIRRLLETLRTTDDPEARAYLEQARAYRLTAHEAREAGDLEAARENARLAFRSVLAAVIEIYPDAPVRTGAAVDEAIARIEVHLGTREAPRIRRVLAHVRELRNRADRALAEGDTVTALALNLRGMQILHWLVEHLRELHDHDGTADREMQEVSF